MSFVFTNQSPSMAVIGAAFIVLGTEIPPTAAAVTFSPDPKFDIVNQRETVLTFPVKS